MEYVRKAIEGELEEGAYPHLVIRVEDKQTYIETGWEETDEQDWLDHSSEEAMADDVNSTEEEEVVE